MLLDTSCGDSRWSEKWNREMAYIKFSNNWDTASDYYREAITGYEHQSFYITVTFIISCMVWYSN